MSDLRLAITETPRSIPPEQDVTTPLYTLAWQTTQKWTAEIKQLKEQRRAAQEGEDRVLILLADEYYRLREVVTAVAPILSHHNLEKEARTLVTAVRRLEQILQEQAVELIAPVGVVYAAELLDLLENVEQITRPEITEPVVQEILTPAIRRGDQIIRLGQAIIAIPEEESVK
jgi:hypothetical protein